MEKKYVINYYITLTLIFFIILFTALYENINFEHQKIIIVLSLMGLMMNIVILDNISKSNRMIENNSVIKKWKEFDEITKKLSCYINSALFVIILIVLIVYRIRVTRISFIIVLLTSEVYDFLESPTMTFVFFVTMILGCLYFF